jgi:hypothetical protein
MAKLENKEELLKFMSDHYDHNFKAANYLLVGHAAGLVGCLSVLKDYDSTPQLKGLGTFVVLFGIGLLSAIVYYASLALARSVVLNAIMNDESHDEATGGFLTKVNLGTLFIAGVTFVVAIGLIMWRFASL